MASSEGRTETRLLAETQRKLPTSISDRRVEPEVLVADLFMFAARLTADCSVHYAAPAGNEATRAQSSVKRRLMVELAAGAEIGRLRTSVVDGRHDYQRAAPNKERADGARLGAHSDKRKQAARLALSRTREPDECRCGCASAPELALEAGSARCVWCAARKSHSICAGDGLAARCCVC